MKAAAIAIGGVGCLFGLVAMAEVRGDPLRGRTVVVEWCSMCHSISGVERDPDRAPTFETISKKPGRDLQYFTRFLDEDHFPMTTFRLFADEKRDVAAFLDDLRKRH